MHASDLIRAVGPQPQSTVQAWQEHPAWSAVSASKGASVDWSAVLVLALRHQLSALLWDALQTAGLSDRVPVRIAEELCFRTELATARHAELVAALSELAEAQPEIVSRSVLLKGGALLSEYEKSAYRPMNDFDILFSSEDFEEIEPRFPELGYWRKESLNGPTYYRARNSPGAPLCMDVHVAGPSKYWRPDSALVRWLTDALPFVGPGGIECRRLSPEFELLNIVTHLHEHLGSWIHALGDDDVALVRLFDVELLAQRRQVNIERCWSLSVEQELQGEFMLGLWAFAEIRGALPASLAPLAPGLELLADVGDMVAVPGGGVAQWSVPLSQRAFLINRMDLAFEALREGLPIPDRVKIADPEHLDGWRHWYRDLGALPEYRERVEDLGARARERLAGFDPSWPESRDGK
ncbi:nucleotidyltransferase family protein [Streptomyces sp. CAU 1734]|uniref:nucleotidyltransferase family protein n=1 Tax=Streptomyces sp. CAU 1734 TaxID=3140360 RepID=UPI0032600916